MYISSYHASRKIDSKVHTVTYNVQRNGEQLKALYSYRKIDTYELTLLYLG